MKSFNMSERPPSPAFSRMDNVYPHLKPCGKKCATGRSCHGGYVSRGKKSCRREMSCSSRWPKMAAGRVGVGRPAGLLSEWQGYNTEDLLWISHGPHGRAHTCKSSRSHPQEGHLEEWTDLSKGRLSFPISRFRRQREEVSNQLRWRCICPHQRTADVESQVWDPETQRALPERKAPADKRHLLGPENSVSSSQDSQSEYEFPIPCSPFFLSFLWALPSGESEPTCAIWGRKRSAKWGEGKEPLCPQQALAGLGNTIHI